MVRSDILRGAVSILSTLLSIIFSHSLSQGPLPGSWMLVHITSIFKGDRSSETSSYRPVALLSIPSKTMESLIWDGLHDYLLSLNFFLLKRRGLGKGDSCITNLLTAVRRWTTIHDCKGKVDVKYLDFSKAFDRLIYICLINNLKRLGTKSPLIGQLTSHLNSQLLKSWLKSLFLRLWNVLVGSSKVHY